MGWSLKGPHPEGAGHRLFLIDWVGSDIGSRVKGPPEEEPAPDKNLKAENWMPRRVLS